MNAQPDQRTSDRLLKIAEVLRRCGISRSSVYLFIKAGTFPLQVRQSKRAVGWSEREVQDRIEARKAEGLLP
jgi:prophage regulatory protein